MVVQAQDESHVTPAGHDVVPVQSTPHFPAPHWIPPLQELCPLHVAAKDIASPAMTFFPHAFEFPHETLQVPEPHVRSPLQAASPLHVIEASVAGLAFTPLVQASFELHSTTQTPGAHVISPLQAASALQ